MPTKLGGKTANRIQSEWNLVQNKTEKKSYVTTNIDSDLARVLEFWAPILVSEKKIKNNSAYAATRYVLENGIQGLNAVMKQKYNKGPD
jgi:hypothetical protein